MDLKRSATVDVPDSCWALAAQTRLSSSRVEDRRGDSSLDSGCVDQCESPRRPVLISPPGRRVIRGGREVRVREPGAFRDPGGGSWVVLGKHPMHPRHSDPLTEDRKVLQWTSFSPQVRVGAPCTSPTPKRRGRDGPTRVGLSRSDPHVSSSPVNTSLGGTDPGQDRRDVSRSSVFSNNERPLTWNGSSGRSLSISVESQRSRGHLDALTPSGNFL